MQPELTVPTVADATFRRAVVVACILGAVALVASVPLGYVTAALFGCIGLALGMLNSRLVQLSVVRFAKQESSRPKRQFVGSVVGRLALITLLALSLALLFRPDGLGVIVGLAVFQLLMIIVASIPMIKELRGS
ncbi:MAG: ATP synthase subunit I [Geodermatophilaceae bacterium]|nr:ATP synthase subunit I [Geodermatophilaceae bacterium]